MKALYIMGISILSPVIASGQQSAMAMVLNHKDMHATGSARIYLLKGLDLAQEVGDKKAIRSLLKELSELEAVAGDFEKAYMYFKSYHTVSDSILNESIADRMAQLETIYEADKKEDEIIKLRAKQKLNLSLSKTLLWELNATAFAALLIISFLMYRARIHRKLFQIEQAQKQRVKNAYDQLKAIQTQLIQAKKMASLGELMAGIAHEIKNPLNFVTNFSEVNNELPGELKVAIAKMDQEEIEALFKDLKENESKDSHHGKRAESIVKGILFHSRGSSEQKEPTDINALCEEYLRLPYHGFRAKDQLFNAVFKLQPDASLPNINVVPQDIGRVLLNLINNAFYVVNKKIKETGNSYKPSVVVETTIAGNEIGINVSDNGSGIPENVRENIFQPFFTTKPTGQGKGLGLSLSYDTVKAHGGEIKLITKEKEGIVYFILTACKF